MCPNEAYNEFLSLYKTAFDDSLPLSTKPAKYRKIKREPWFSAGLLVSSRKRRKLFSKKLNKPTESNILAFKKYNNLFNKLKRAMKITYFETAIEENKFNIKKTWTILRQVIGKLNDKSNYPSTFLINDTPIKDRSHVAESFNNYFVKIGVQTSHNVPRANTGFLEYMPRSIMHSMFLEPVAPSEVLLAASKLKSKTSHGHDGISTKLLKDTIPIIIHPITHIINRSFETGVVPQEMKMAKVVPIHKSSDRSLLKNYRPVSLLPAFSKILERLMYNKLISFLNRNNILFRHQYGFRSKHSTVHPILHLLNHCAESSNKPDPDYTLAILCDLSKAFDVISHEILLRKLNYYGIRGNVNSWFESYLSHRKQFVELDNHKSASKSIVCGVPQGSILGPLLYLIYVNDIGNSCEGNILSFADDTTLYMSNSNLNKLFSDVNIQINNLFQWFCANKLSLNANKTKYILIRPRQKQCNLSALKIYINNSELKRIGHDCEEKAAKFLGIIIDEYLTWKYHIAHVNNKVSRSLFAIKQVKHFLPKSSLRTLYFSMIHSHFSYGLLAWGNANKSALHRSIILQKRALRTINNAKYNSHTDPLFKSSNILKLNDLYEHQVILFMFDYLSNKLPISFVNTFVLNRNMPNSRLTRQSDLLFITRCQSQFANSLPLYAFPVMWNKWVATSMVTISMSRYRFKVRTKYVLLERYQRHVTCQYRKCPDCFPMLVNDHN
jgi:hypothetical protein